MGAATVGIWGQKTDVLKNVLKNCCGKRTISIEHVRMAYAEEHPETNLQPWVGPLFNVVEPWLVLGL